MGEGKRRLGDGQVRGSAEVRGQELGETGRAGGLFLSSSSPSCLSTGRAHGKMMWLKNQGWVFDRQEEGEGNVQGVNSNSELWNQSQMKREEIR